MQLVELFESDAARHPLSGIEHDSRKHRPRNNPTDPMGPLCRKLIEAGYDPDDEVLVVRDGMRVWKRNRTIGAWADENISDRVNQGGFHRRRYVPYPDMEVRKTRE